MFKHSAGAERIFAALLSGVLIYGFAMGTSYPLLGIVLADKVTDMWNGVSVAATGFGLILGALSMPTVNRWVGAGTTAIVGIVMMAGALVGLSVANDFTLIFVSRLVLGMGANWMFVATETSLNILTDPKSRGRIFGLYSMLTGLGFIVGPAMVAFLPDYPALLLAACAGIVLFALVPFWLVRSTLDGQIPVPTKSSYAPSIKALPFAFVLLFIAASVDAVMIALLPVISIRSGLTGAEGAILVTVFHVGLVSGQPIIGRLLDVWGRKKTIMTCLFISIAATYALAAGGGEDFIFSCVLIFCWGAVNFGLYTAGLTLIGDHFSGAALSAATGSFAVVYAIAAIIAPILVGVGLEITNALAFYGFVGSLYSGAFVWAIYRFRPLEPVKQTA